MKKKGNTSVEYRTEQASRDARAENRRSQRQPFSMKSRAYTSLLLSLLALVAVTAATVAWFSIADSTRVRTMSLDIMADTEMRMDLDAHESIEQYVRTLSFEQIAKRMQREKGFSMETTPLEPVTTADAVKFMLENGRVVDSKSGAYLEFDLHFMAEKDMDVHLTSADSKSGAGDGTSIRSKNPGLARSMRISFATDGQTWIYDPGMGNTSRTKGGIKTFGLPDSGKMHLTKDNFMFSLKEGQDKTVRVHIWLEGTDEACTDDLKGAEYAIRLRFTGETDEDTREN